MEIPYNRPSRATNDMTYLQLAHDNGTLNGAGRFTEMCENLLTHSLGARALLTTSCTDALEMCAQLVDIVPGDEVIVPAYTYPSSAGAFERFGAVPVFADVDPMTLCLDAREVQKHITTFTKAIVTVHYAGVPSCMEDLQAFNLPVIEDAAHALFGKWKGRALGTIGDFGTFSFHDTKNFSSGEGGAFTAKDEDVFDTAQVIRECGTNRLLFMQGRIGAYEWVSRGSSHLPSELNAAMLLAQLEEAERIQHRRKFLFHTYIDFLSNWAKLNRVTLPTIPDGAEPAYHLFWMLFPSADARRRVQNHLKVRGITASPHYKALNNSPMGKHYLNKPGSCPVSEHAEECLLRLPLYTALTDEEQDRVIHAVHECL